MSTSLLDELKEDINERQEELFSIQAALEAEARRASNVARLLRIAVIFLGAFGATREVADTLTGGRRHSVIVIYTLLGLAITVIGSIAATLQAGQQGGGTQNLGGRM
jgi:hypothetical protein